MKHKLLFGLLLSFLLTGFLSLPSVLGDINISACSDLNIAGETYYLMQDIINSTNSTCIDITANNITFDCQNKLIDGIDTGGTYGISIYHETDMTTNITIKNCIVSDWDFGIILVGSHYNNLTNITSYSNINGIELSNSKHNIVDEFYISDNTYGLYFFTNSDYNTIKNGVVNYNNYGIPISTAYYNNFKNIDVLFNINDGIFLQTSHFNNFTDMTIKSNQNDGFVLYYSNSSVLDSSIIENNTHAGVYIFQSGLNKIFNNFFNNSVNVNLDSPQENSWNTTKQTGIRIYSDGTEIGGNYWSNSTGTGFSDTCIDSNTDGFCDVIYTLHAENLDYLPLSNDYILTEEEEPSVGDLFPILWILPIMIVLVGLISFGTIAISKILALKDLFKVFFLIVLLIVFTMAIAGML